VLAPLAVSDWLAPYAIEAEDGVIATVGKLLFVSTTSSVDAVQVPLLIVQRRVALEPAGTPVTPEVADDDVVIVAVPLVTVQAPVPVVGLLPASVNEPSLHFDWSAPAFAPVGTADTVLLPVAAVWDVAPVEDALTLPLTPFVASDFSRTYIVVVLTLPPLCVTVTELPKPLPLDNDTS
jgi:hypothetical protein